MDLNKAEIVRSLRALFGFRGATELEVLEQIMPTANLADLDGPPYHTKVGGTFALQSGPTIAQFPYVGIRNPLTNQRNHRAVVRRITAQTSATNTFIKVANSAALDAVLAAPALNAINGSWDSPEPDQGTIRQSLQSYQTTNAAAFGQDGMIIISPAGIQLTQEGPWVLAPGNTLFLQGQTLNTAIIGSFYWDEYLIG